MNATVVGAYRVLLRLYPRGFRDEYGTDMTLLFANQLRDEPVGRVCVRGAVDLAITIPTRHLEAHMDRPPNPLVPMLFAGIGFTGLGVAIIGGSSPGMLAVGLSIAVAAVVLAAIAWRGVRPVSTTPAATAHWWKFLAGGATVLSAVIITTSATGEVDDSMWWPLMITIGCALALLGTGLVLGIAQHSARRPRNAPG